MHWLVLKEGLLIEILQPVTLYLLPNSTKNEVNVVEVGADIVRSIMSMFQKTEKANTK
jgi:hypothetical protein